MDLQISEYLSTNNYARAIQTLNEYLQNPEVKGSVSAYLGCLVTRLECYFKLGQYEHVISEGRNILNGFYDPKEEKTFDKVIRCYINSLFQLKRYQETETLLKQWIGVKNGDNPEAFKLLNTLHSAIRNVGLKSPVDIHSEMVSKLQVDPTIVTTLGLSHHHPLHPQQQQPHLPPQHPLNLQQQQQLPASAMVSTSASSVTIASSLLANASPMASVGPTGTTCTYCRLTFADKQLLRAHCQTLDHQRVIMSDEGRDWAWRAPPRGLSAEEYRLCASVIGTPAAAATSAAGASGAGCRYGLQCVEAHSQAELLEWRERFEYRKMKYQRAYEKELYGKSYTEEILDKWIEASAPDNVLKESLRYVQLIVDGKPSISITSKNSRHTWTFRLVVSRDPDEPRRILKGVALLQDTFRSHFQLAKVGYEIKKGKENGDKGGDKNLDRTKDGDDNNEIVEFGMKHDQEWLTIASAIPDCVIKDDGDSNQGCYIVSVMFKTDIFGTFRQSVVFDFGTEPYLVQHLCADVIPVTDHHRINELRHELVLSCEERWSASNSTIVPYSPPPAAAAAVDAAAATGAGKGKKNRSAKEVEDMLSKTLSAKYPCPQANTLTLSPGTVTEKRLTKNNYNCRMHELLFIEEISRYDQVAKFNLTTHLLLVNSYLLSPNGMASTTAKYAAAGELFAALKLGGTLSEDTSAGRLVLSNCVAVLVRPLMNQRLSGKSVIGVTMTEQDDHGETNRVVYEAPIEDKGKTDIYIRLPAAAVKIHNLKPDQSFHCQIQFQLNRVPYCEWHHSVDSVTDYRLIFPETYLDPAIPWSPQRQWADITDPRLNVKQKEAVVAITTPMHVRLPPVLIIGPFGTGKTFTLAQAIKQLMRQPEARVLVCTHSNSAADLYIKDYLHPFVEEGHIEARPLRILYHKRWISTVNEVVQKYCLINTDPTAIAQGSYFHVPTAQDVMSHRIVVVTLNASMYLATLDLPRGFFTHIILDEAAQAMECEAIMPLAMANEATRIVLAGDHMQLSPELFSGFTKERNMHVSLLERLYDHYPPTFPCKILLSENYRAHEAIIDFTSESFYDQKLIASGRQPRHELYYPLTFFTTRGEDVQDTNSTAFYNNSEVYEIVDRVHELKNHWPTTWGKFDESSIGIMTPYADQVLRIRSELRKRRLFTISVERVLNVQGKQFRAVFLSTVRTRRTCTTSANSSSSSTATAAATKNNNAGGSGEEAEFGFLSNSKLLNTAITRAQSLVAVVGDPVALCTIGRCSKVWERFIQVCNENQSLFGITWSNLKNQLDGVELKKTYVLNPLAPEFIPRRLQQQQLQQQQQQQQQLQQQQIQLQQQQLQQAAMMKAEHSYIHPLAHHIPNLQTALVKQTFFNGYDKKPFPFDASSAAAAAAAAAVNAAAVTATGPVLPSQMVLSPDLLSRPPNTYDQLLPNRLQAYQYLSNPAAQTANVQQQQQPPPPPQAMHHPTYSMNQLPNGFNLLPRINNIHPAQAQVQPHHDSPNNGDLTSLYLRNAEQVQAGTSLQYLAEDRKATLIPNIPNMSTNSMVHLDATSVALRLAYDLPNQTPANNGIQNKYLCLPTYQQQQQQQPPPTSHDLTSVEALSNALSTSAGLQPTNLVNNHLQQPPQQQQQTVQNLYRNDTTLIYNQRPPAVAPIVNMLPDYSTVVTSNSNTNVNILSPGKQQEQQLELNQRFASNVQFLQNVHFPPDSKSAQQSQQIPNLTLARVEFTYQDLVPRGMSIDDVLQLPLQTKRQWYSFLAHNRGTEAARTFELLLDQALARKQQQQQQQLIAEMASPWINHHQQQQQMVMMNGNNCPPQINDDPRQNGYISSKVVQSESQPLYKRQGMQDQGLTIQQQQQLSYHQQEHVAGPPLSVGWSYPQATAGMSDGAGCSSSQQQHKWKQEINEDFGNLSIQNGEDSVDDMVERYNGIMSYANVVRNSTASSSTAAKVDSKLDSCVTSNNSVDPQSLRNSRLYQYF